MKPIYHYSTVYEALNELNGKGFAYDFNLHEEGIKKKNINMKSNMYIGMKEILILEMNQSFME